ncbi:hypothetical protein F4779DRAFT_148213 [Xylariaceae sp. FL0662B]|nr:hypothetical protein F4779DRAFT_148213 [Xylariaceae sp. FL0662B]
MSDHLKPVTHKRRRPAKSCEPCRVRKVGCDRRLPCSRCQKARAPLLCSYKSGSPINSSSSTTQEDIPTGGLRSERDTGDVPSNSTNHCLCVSDRLSQTQEGQTSSLPKQHDQSQPFLPPAPDGSIRLNATSGTQNLEERISRIEQRVSALTHNGVSSENTGLSIILPRPYLRVDHEKTRLFGQGHWVHTLEQFHILARMQAKPYGFFDNTQAETSKNLREAANARRLAKNRQSSKIQELFPDLSSTIPAKDVCDQAVECYLRSFEPIFRILHVPSFMYDYQEYWFHPCSSPTSFLMKLLMVLTIGAVFVPDRAVSNQIRHLARDWAYVVQWWLVGPTERDAMSLDGVQAFCLLILARQVNSLGGTASIATEALLKLSFTLGLHLDPKTVGPMTNFQSEIRRRLWATVRELILITSINSTFPLLISYDDFECRPPSNIKDVDLQTDNGLCSVSQADNRDLDLDCSLQLLLLRSLSSRMKMIRQLNNCNRNYPYEQVLAFGDELKACCREIAVFFQSASSTQDRPSPYSDFHRKFLDTYMRVIVLFIHRPFLIGTQKDHRFYLARKVCLESCIIIASYADGINLPSEALDDFSRLCSRGNGFFKGPLGQDVISAIALEIVTQMEEEQIPGAQKSPEAETADPLVQLARANRRPLIRTLEHIREQWRHIIILGRPSLKQFIFLSVILSQIKAKEAGQDPNPLIHETLKTTLKECATMLQESGAYSEGSGSTGEFTDDTSPYSTDMMSIFGFDFNALDPSSILDIPDALDFSNLCDNAAIPP